MTTRHKYWLHISSTNQATSQVNTASSPQTARNFGLGTAEATDELLLTPAETGRETPPGGEGHQALRHRQDPLPACPGRQTRPETDQRRPSRPVRAAQPSPDPTRHHRPAGPAPDAGAGQAPTDPASGQNTNCRAGIHS